MEITFIDQGDNLSHMTIGVRGADIAAAETNAAANINDIIALTDAYVLSYSVREKFLNGAARTPAGEVEEKAVLTLQLATAGKKAVFVIPAPKDTLFVAASGPNFNVVDGADSAIVAIVGDFADTGGSFYISDGETVADTGGFIKGRRTHRASSRG